MVKEIKIIRGEEFKVQVRDRVKKNDIFVEEYQRAAQLLEEILYASRNQLKANVEGKNIFSINNHTDFNNNIIAFCGERGDGKSSAMMTFMNVVKNPIPQYDEDEDENGQCILFKEDSIVRKTKFIDTIHVDPSALDVVHNVLDIVVANMFRHFKRVHENGKIVNNTDRREHLVKCFQNVYRALSLKKDIKSTLEGEFDDEGSVAKLSKLSDSMRLKEYMSNLLYAYFSYMNSATDDDIKKYAILISIDDLDLSISTAYAMSEEIRKYLVLPGIVIVMAVRTKQLQMSVEEYNIIQLKDHFEKMDVSQMRQEIQEMAERYVSKLIPLAHRIYLPKIQKVRDVSMVYVDKESGENITENGVHSIVEFVMKKIYQKTGMIFRPYSQGHSFILPNNIRGMISLIALLDGMKNPQDEKTETLQEMIKYENILNIFNSYYRELINVLPARNENEIFFRKEIKELIDLDVYTHLHIGAATLLDAIHERYYGATTTTKLSNNFASDSNYGIDTMCCVMNMMREILRIHYKEEPRTYSILIAFLYTIKLNLLLNNKKKNDYEFDFFIKYAIWGYDLLRVIPFVVHPVNGFPRSRFALPSVNIFNCISESLKLPLNAKLKLSDTVHVPHEITKTSQHRKKYIFAWIIFGMLCNNYDTSSNKSRVMMLPWNPFIYDNSVLNASEQVSIENFIIRVSMMESLYAQLNFEILDIERDEFQEIIDTLRKQNKIWVLISRLIITNIDVIQDLLDYCTVNNDYRKKTDGEEDRSERLIEKFLCNLVEYFKNRGYVSEELAADDAVEKICNFHYGETENESINIPKLYAKLIQQTITPSIVEVENNVASIRNELQEFRDALEMRNIIQNTYREFAKFVTTKTKLAKVQEHLLNMAGDIGKYMLLSGDRVYLSNEWKMQLCSLYEEVLKGQQIDKDAIVTDEIRLAYKEAANKFDRDYLKEAIMSLQKNE